MLRSVTNRQVVRLCQNAIGNNLRRNIRALSVLPIKVGPKIASRNIDLVAASLSYTQVRCFHEDWNQDLEYEDVVALVSSKDIQLIDVREPFEVLESGMIPTATNIPLGHIKSALTLTDGEFSRKYSIPKPQKTDKNLVFYGLGPIKSSAAIDLAAKVGYKKARHYIGGWEEWVMKHNKK